MADSPLLVPISVEGLLVNTDVVNRVPFRQWAMNYGAMATFSDPEPPPFNNISVTPPANGMHIRWTLPSALTHGTASPGQPVTFPLTPNRWMVIRYGASATPNGPRQTTTWIVQSDYLDPVKGSSAFVDPFAPNGAIQPTMVGRSMLLGAWTGDSSSPQSLFLRATGPGNVSFAAYQPGARDVYSFYDDTTKIPDGTALSYLVLGWYSDPTRDPLAATTPDTWVSTLKALNWSASKRATNLPSQVLLHGMLSNVAWQSTSTPPRVDSSSASMQVAVGNTAIDALAAIVAENATGDAGDTLALRLAAFQYNALSVLDQPDGTAQVEALIRKAWFGTTASGTSWTVVAAQQGVAPDNSLDPGVVPTPPALTPAQLAKLATLNQDQHSLDEMRAQLKSMQAQLYAAWWMSKRAPIEASIAPPPNTDMGAVQAALTAALTPDPAGNTTLISQVSALLNQVSTLAATLPDPTSPDSISAYAATFLDITKLTLRPKATTPYYQPSDPVVLVAGITPPVAAVDSTVALPCRYADEAATGVNVVSGGGTSAVTTATRDVATLVQAPVNPVLPPVVVAGINTMAVDTLFSDPVNAAAIAQHGIGATDPATVSALQAAMAAGTAQIASVNGIVNAPFAYAAWAQPWSPLYLEWDITFEPTLTANPVGQSWQGFRDNWAFDPTNWVFDGSDNVIARGSEYYTFTAGDPPTPRTYTGRTFLTPQTTSLMIQRLEEYLKQHPDAELQEIDTLIDQIGQTRFLSQALSGFTADLAMVSQQQIQPPDASISSLVGDQYRGAPDVALGDQDFSFEGGTPFFMPVRAGFFRFHRLAIVDSYGQVLNLLNANGNVGGVDLTFEPIRGRGLVPDASSSLANPAQMLKLAPRVVQPSRLNLEFLDAANDQRPVSLNPAANPVCGWFLPNHLDHGIMVYDANGNALGELILLADATGASVLRWLPAPASPFAVTDPSTIANTHLGGAIMGLLAINDGGVAFNNFFQAIDETLWSVDPIGARGDADLAALIGRPLALVRADVSFELAGMPRQNLSWMDVLFPNPETAGFTTIPFPIRLGSLELLDDGVIGYFLGDTYSSFNTVHSPRGFTPTDTTYLQPVGWNGNYIELSFDYPNYPSQVISMLIDPRGVVHGTTGILPMASLELASELFEPALKNMAVTFRAGPLLADPASIRLPYPAEQHGVWSWVTQTTPAPAPVYVAQAILASTDAARLPVASPHLMDGWLMFQPSTISAAPSEREEN